jgi:hypothetical protein
MHSDLCCRYIKDYDGGTLMECRIDPKLPYTDLPAMIRCQRQVWASLCFLAAKGSSKDLQGNQSLPTFG